ncbi:hypothetical protein ACRRTK_014645 [Alexandromys fortis]
MAAPMGAGRGLEHRTSAVADGRALPRLLAEARENERLGSGRRLSPTRVGPGEREIKFGGGQHLITAGAGRARSVRPEWGGRRRRPAARLPCPPLRSCTNKLHAEWEQPEPGARGRGVSMTTTSGTRVGSAWAHARVRVAVRPPSSFLSRPRCWSRFREPR